jgi:CHAT domain
MKFFSLIGISMKVLYIASNPSEASEVDLAREITELQRRASIASGEPVTFIFLPAIAFERLPLELHHHRPDIVHFSGHGDKAQLHFSNESGALVPVTGKMLSEFFNYENPPKLVYLNACDSANLAKELKKVIPIAIGTTAPITNRAAWASAVVFYDRLLMGMSVQNAYEAGNQMIQCLQQKSASSSLYCGKGVDASVERLHSIPRIVAWPEDGNFVFDKDGLINIDIKLIGCPANTLQVIFFTDDKRMILNDPDDDQSGAAFLAGELCQLVRDTPRHGIIETDDFWPTEQDFRVFACGTTSGGSTFTVSSTVCAALKDYAAHVMLWSRDNIGFEQLLSVINRLKDPNPKIGAIVPNGSKRKLTSKTATKSLSAFHKPKQKNAGTKIAFTVKQSSATGAPKKKAATKPLSKQAARRRHIKIAMKK